MNKYFGMTVLQTVSAARAGACPPPCVSTTNELGPVRHRSGKISARSRSSPPSLKPIRWKTKSVAVPPPPASIHALPGETVREDAHDPSEQARWHLQRR